MPYVIAPLSEVKSLNNWPEYVEAMRELQVAAFARAAQVWPGFTPGGLVPGARQYGIGPFRKNDMAGDTTDSTPSGSYTFRKTFTSTGWTDVLHYTVRVGELHAFCGFAITDDVLRVIQWKMTIGTKVFPIWDLQEAQRYNKFATVLKSDKGEPLLADPGTAVIWRMYAETVGVQRIVPLGFQIFNRTDLVLNEI